MPIPTWRVTIVDADGNQHVVDVQHPLPYHARFAAIDKLATRLVAEGVFDDEQRAMMGMDTVGEPERVDGDQG